jgi:hypothetical protein
MTRCDARCQSCRVEIRKLTKECKRLAQIRRHCREGPHPTLTEGEEGEEEEGEEEEKEEDREYRDRILATVLYPEKQQINATMTISQRLAEAATKAQELTPKGLHELVPEHLHTFEDVFSKVSFDALPEYKKWDHTIELIP